MLAALAFCLCTLVIQTPDSVAPVAPSQDALQDAISVLLPADKSSLLEGGGREGRIVLFLIATSAKLDGEQPADAPFYDSPQPVFSVPVSALVPGKPIVFGADAAAFPVPLNQLSGEYRIQAVFDRDTEQRTHLVPGNLLSGVQTVQLDPGRIDTVVLELTEKVPPTAPPEAPNLRLFTMKSRLLSEAAGHDVFMRAGVALPQGWDDPSYRRRMWPAIYVVPGFGGRESGAMRYARMLTTEGGQAVVPQAVWIVLDPESGWGHHGFVDSPANGPRGKALVQELIPELERQFRLVSRTDARVITGHSSGGWTSLWLQLTYPEIFGACFSSAPDPVDFSAFQTVDLYHDTSYFSDAEGKERPSYRVPIVKQYEKVRMTNREEAGAENAISPEGRSGEQLDTYNAMWSALDPRTRLPRRFVDPVTGIIDHELVEREWSRFDITRQVSKNPALYVPIMRQRVRLLVGERDNFYLERAVKKLQEAVDAAGAAAKAKGAAFPDGPGYIQIIPEQTHFTLPGVSMLRWHNEIREYLKANGLD